MVKKKKIRTEKKLQSLTLEIAVYKYSLEGTCDANIKLTVTLKSVAQNCKAYIVCNILSAVFRSYVEIVTTHIRILEEVSC